MKKLGKIVAAFGALAMLIVGGTACGSVVKTGQDTQALWYQDGEFSAQTFKGCVSNAERDRKGLGDTFYYYPVGQRTYSFTGRSGSEAKPIAVKTKDSQQMTVTGFITFELTTNCETLKKFHDEIGQKYKAYFPKGASDSEGWGKFLNDYVAVPLNSVLDSAALQYGWRDLYSDSEVQVEYQQYVQDKIDTEVDNTIGIKDVITVRGVAMEKPKPSEALLQTIQQVEQARAEGEAEREKVNQQRQTQQEKTKLEQDKIKTTQECLKVYTQEQCFWKDLASGPNPPDYYPVPQGGSVVINPGENKE